MARHMSSAAVQLVVVPKLAASVRIVCGTTTTRSLLSFNKIFFGTEFMKFKQHLIIKTTESAYRFLAGFTVPRRSHAISKSRTFLRLFLARLENYLVLSL